MKGFLVILLAAAFLTGCVSMQTPEKQPEALYQKKTAQERQTQLAPVTSWDANGALSIQQAGRSPMIMRYQWQQMGSDHYHINLAASLNLAEVTISGQPGRVTLQRGNEPPVSARTPEELMRKNLGWSLPVPSLWYWARGLPAPGASQGAQYDAYGHLIALHQNGWQVQLSDYKTVQGVDLPQVIELSQANIKAKIVVKKWQLMR